MFQLCFVTSLLFESHIVCEKQMILLDMHFSYNKSKLIKHILLNGFALNSLNKIKKMIINFFKNDNCAIKEENPLKSMTVLSK